MVNYLEIISIYYPGVQCDTSSALDNYDNIHWINTEPIPKSELDAKALDHAKLTHVQELSDQAESRIRAGFWSNALGSPHFYDSEIEDQINLVGVVTIGSDSPYACRPGSKTAVKQYFMHTAAQLRQVAEDGKVVKLTHLQAFGICRVQIMQATTIEQVYQIQLPNIE